MVLKNWWALLDSNQRPTDYESAALTAELRALRFSRGRRPRAAAVAADSEFSMSSTAHFRAIFAVAALLLRAVTNCAASTAG